MDLLTLAMAKAYSDSKGGYVEPAKVLTFDGNIEGKEQFSSDELGFFVKISNEVPDPDSIVSYTHVMEVNGEIIGGSIMQKGEFTLQGDSAIYTIQDYSEIINVIGAAQDVPEDGITKGLYVRYRTDTTMRGYVSRIELAEIIHTIDPKFLPPMSNGINIDLDKYGIGSVLLELFAQGGGNATLESVDGPEHLRNLWDVASDQPDADIILTMRVGVTVLVIRGVTKSFIDTQCTSLVFSTLLSDGGSSYLLNVQIMQLDRGATIILRVS